MVKCRADKLAQNVRICYYDSKLTATGKRVPKVGTIHEVKTEGDSAVLVFTNGETLKVYKWYTFELPEDEKANFHNSAKIPTRHRPESVRGVSID